MKDIVILHFNVSNERDEINDLITDKTFETIDDLKNFCKKNHLILNDYYTLYEHIENLNDEMYPTDEWCSYCFIKNFKL